MSHKPGWLTAFCVIAMGLGGIGLLFAMGQGAVLALQGNAQNMLGELAEQNRDAPEFQGQMDLQRRMVAVGRQ